MRSYIYHNNFNIKMGVEEQPQPSIYAEAADTKNFLCKFEKSWRFVINAAIACLHIFLILLYFIAIAVQAVDPRLLSNLSNNAR